MEAAVNLWSPVIMTGRIPARRQRATAKGASFLGGSIKAAKPTNIRSLSQVLCTEAGDVFGRSRYPMASTRSASRAYICKMSPRCFFCRELSPFSPSFVSILVQRDKRISGAPFVIQRSPPEKEWIVDILFLLESNGISSIKGKSFFQIFTGKRCSAAYW
ncbi:unknown [Roseburia sp. CAG:309]|nr:unknown [Roseburia sp. CAG:309]